jgi:hypothetical protein
MKMSSTCLRLEPIPQCYGATQSPANSLLFAGSNGIVYPTVRNSRGTSIPCFRSALVCHPRNGSRIRFAVAAGVTWDTAHAQQLSC